MEQGFLPDGSYADLLISYWAKGSPKKSFWKGTKRPAEMIPIGVFRCASCGFLEAYARHEYAHE